MSMFHAVQKIQETSWGTLGGWGHKLAINGPSPGEYHSDTGCSERPLGPVTCPWLLLREVRVLVQLSGF